MFGRNISNKEYRVKPEVPLKNKWIGKCDGESKKVCNKNKMKVIEGCVDDRIRKSSRQ